MKAASGARIDPFHSWTVTLSVVVKFHRTRSGGGPSSLSELTPPSNFPSTLISVVELAGTFTVMFLMPCSWDRVRLNTLRVVLVPVRT